MRNGMSHVWKKKQKNKGDKLLEMVSGKRNIDQKVTHWKCEKSEFWGWRGYIRSSQARTLDFPRH